MTYEPELDDPIARDIYPECDDCGAEHDYDEECSDDGPDRMWGDDD